MLTNHIPALWNALIEFYRFSPSRLRLNFFLMLVQGATSSIGLLLLVPLLSLIGFQFGVAIDSGLAGIMERLFAGIGFSLTLPIILLTYIIIVSITAMIRYQLSVMSVTLQQNYICYIRNRLYRAILHSHWQFIVHRKMSDFTHSLTGEVQTIGNVAQQILSLFSQIILTAFYISLSFFLSWQMSLVAMVCAGGLMLLLLPLNRIIYGSGQVRVFNFKMIFQMITEQLSSLKMIKSYASEKHYADQVEQVGIALEQQQIQMTKVNALTQLVYMVGAVIAFSLLFYVAIEWLAIGSATLFLLLLIFSRLLPQVATIQQTVQRLIHQLPAFENVQNLILDCEADQESEETSGLQVPRLMEKIRLDDVSFHYQNQQVAVIEHLSLEILCNQSVALVGPSGAGKSTLADLIAGLLTPSSGRIYCDATVLEKAHRLAWRSSLAYVTQEVFLFHDTIRSNLSWVASDVSDEDIWQMLRLAAADEFVANLPHGLETLIGDRGVRLSGGERQRLALARALLSKPQLLILDEATSALDYENERKIQQALARLQGKLTIVIIAHRETTIEHVDHIIRLAKIDSHSKIGVF